MRVKVKSDGTILLLYADDLLAPLSEVGEVSVARASLVEFNCARGGWTVEFASGGWLGPGGALSPDETGAEVFRARRDALAAEVCYLEVRL